MKDSSKGEKEKMMYLRIEAPLSVMDWLRVFSHEESLRTNRTISKGEIVRNLLIREKERYDLLKYDVI